MVIATAAASTWLGFVDRAADNFAGPDVRGHAIESRRRRVPRIALTPGPAMTDGMGRERD
jgi:hypothetical protein